MALARLAAELAFERTSRYRTLTPLRRRGLVLVRAGADRRAKDVALTGGRIDPSPSDAPLGRGGVHWSRSLRPERLAGVHGPVGLPHRDRAVGASGMTGAIVRRVITTA